MPNASLMALTAGLLGGAAVLACAPTATPPSSAAGAADYAGFCAACHGPSGRGDGPAAAGLSPRPADLTTIARRNGGTFPRLQVMGRIYGYTAGRSDSPMPPFGDLLEGESVLHDAGDGIPTPTPVRLIALADHLAGLQR